MWNIYSNALHNCVGTNCVVIFDDPSVDIQSSIEFSSRCLRLRLTRVSRKYWGFFQYEYIIYLYVEVLCLYPA